MNNAYLHSNKTKTGDNCFTPDYAIYPLLKYLDQINLNKKIKIWCPFDTLESNFYKVLKNHDFNVICSHESNNLNFFEYEPDDYDIIISNPPYSIKDRVLERLYSFKKPFAMLLPVTCIQGIKRFKLFSKYGLQLLILDQRINYFLGDYNKPSSNCHFGSAYFCYKFLPSDICYANIKKKTQG